MVRPGGDDEPCERRASSRHQAAWDLDQRIARRRAQNPPASMTGDERADLVPAILAHAQVRNVKLETLRSCNGLGPGLGVEHSDTREPPSQSQDNEACEGDQGQNGEPRANVEVGRRGVREVARRRPRQDARSTNRQYRCDGPGALSVRRGRLPWGQDSSSHLLSPSPISSSTIRPRMAERRRRRAWPLGKIVRPGTPTWSLRTSLRVRRFCTLGAWLRCEPGRITAQLH